MRGVTAVLVHGAGHTASVWDATRASLAHRSFAVDLPGRGSRPAGLASVTVAEAADSVAADVDGAVEGGVEGDLVLVAHSVAGTILPSIAGRLGRRVRHLVFVAGITAPDGELPLEVFLPGQAEVVAARLAELRQQLAGRTLEEMDVRTASSIDSLNFSSQTMDWAGLPDSLPRTFIRCLRDPIQPRDMQARFAANCGASEVLDIDSGHTPALDAPEALAELLDRVLDDAAGARWQATPAGP